jgi:hypothetical protein
MHAGTDASVCNQLHAGRTADKRLSQSVDQHAFGNRRESGCNRDGPWAGRAEIERNCVAAGGAVCVEDGLPKGPRAGVGGRGDYKDSGCDPGF